ncbi:hypothetical protein GKE82_07515 [Conexibacter sp. W3-3-2]|uniref:hypothetical protein n=1 Tax=Conexibacter sp. W3-3-2 TaxID=2675227 RepID=UPI0012B79F95|nr:hypothetical protein [Conexibacter sp. W3-3-2]MTD44151.1 hypothetical protein [Conexibacter sp. W3-3-2]
MKAISDPRVVDLVAGDPVVHGPGDELVHDRAHITPLDRERAAQQPGHAVVSHRGSSSVPRRPF